MDWFCFRIEFQHKGRGIFYQGFLKTLEINGPLGLLLQKR